MKNLLLAFAIIASLISCRSEDEKDLEVDQFVGTWNWVFTTGGLANVNLTPQGTGKTASITLTGNYIYIITEDGAVTSEGTYTLQKNVTTTDHANRVFIYFSNGMQKAVSSVSDTELNLYDDATDGYHYHYAK